MNLGRSASVRLHSEAAFFDSAKSPKALIDLLRLRKLLRKFAFEGGASEALQSG